MKMSRYLPLLMLCFFPFLGWMLPSHKNPWHSMTKRDLSFMVAQIKKGHPGMVDPLNPDFKSTLMQAAREAKSAISSVTCYEGY
jgi:hypothetical protein